MTVVPPCCIQFESHRLFCSVHPVLVNFVFLNAKWMLQLVWSEPLLYNAPYSALISVASLVMSFLFVIIFDHLNVQCMLHVAIASLEE